MIFEFFYAVKMIAKLLPEHGLSCEVQIQDGVQVKVWVIVPSLVWKPSKHLKMMVELKVVEDIDPVL